MSSFIAAVEQITGRTVRGFVSGNDIDHDSETAPALPQGAMSGSRTKGGEAPTGLIALRRGWRRGGELC
ncbi:MAG: hypothetical protein M3433_00335 [Actinomycetota bacterium]|nr:hypothetical protein [Actinomycetota bacterium]